MNDTLSSKKLFMVEPLLDGMRIDRFLAAVCPEHSRSSFQKLLKNGHVAVEGAVVRQAKVSVASGMLVEVEFPAEEPLCLSGEMMDLRILFEDDDLLVLDKPAGLVVHPAAGNWSGTLVNALLGRDVAFAERFEEDAVGEVRGTDPLRPGIVHRLDKDTSGCLVIAKNSAAKRSLSADFEARNVTKIYSSIVSGHPASDSFEVRTLIGRDPFDRKKMAVVERGGREAVTIVGVERKGWIGAEPASLLNVRILTGRTHQIRVHLAHMKVPVVGDAVYGGRGSHIDAPRQMLHARFIGLPHPVSRKPMRFECPFPDDFTAVLDGMRLTREG